MSHVFGHFAKPSKDTYILSSIVVKAIYDKMQSCIINIKDNVNLGKKVCRRDLQRMLDKGRIEPEVLQCIAQDCATLYHLKGVLDALKIDMDYKLKIRKQGFETQAWLWSDMLS